MCRPLKLSVMVMPKLMVSLAVASRVPSRWYSLFDSNFFLEMFRVLHLSVLRLIARPGVTPVGELSQVLLKRDLIRQLQNYLV